MELVMKKNNKLFLLLLLSLISFQTSGKILVLDEFQLESEIKKKEKILHDKKNKQPTADSGEQDADDETIHYSGDEILVLQKDDIKINKLVEMMKRYVIRIKE